MRALAAHFGAHVICFDYRGFGDCCDDIAVAPPDGLYLTGVGYPEDPFSAD